ncbi:2'-5' RNA ligase [Desulfonema limicola]|uniref:RNA 2',3'-cyclic phosphodiesterase n=1 Tax=Desulfonema limicola TaxID=45656 RepID=A0A975BDF1_9BACT|nr:RNA 2',3'-cyclic phosphodiesterase [Desulfonema limicola]QTA83288.1 2'-5' RNA ligase [Desulfonema limicola]
MSETIRSFIAVPLPESIKKHIQGIQNNIRLKGLKMRWVKLENIHLTLKFLGDIPLSDIDAVSRTMAQAAESFTPMTLGVKGIGVFPGIKNPRILWAGMNGGTHSLIHFQQTLENSLIPLGFKKEKRSFKAHLTIARIKDRIFPKDIIQIIEKFGNFESEPFTAEEIILYQSLLKPTGPVYTGLKTIKLIKQ